MTNDIHFLNIDLDIESTTDITPIITEWGDAVSVMRNDYSEGVYCASFETGYLEENAIIEQYVSLINNLSASSKKIWDNCIKRNLTSAIKPAQNQEPFTHIYRPNQLKK